MNDLQQQQLAAIRERNHLLAIRLNDVPETLILPSTAGQFVVDIDFLLTLLADAERERDEAKRRADECEDVIATTTDLANTWARESSVPEADGNVFSGFILRELIDRLWVRANERWIKQVRRNDETTAELATATERAADAERAEIVAKIADHAERTATAHRSDGATEACNALMKFAGLLRKRKENQDGRQRSSEESVLPPGSH